MKITSRDLRLDGLKLFLVGMVVAGHCIQPFRYDNVFHGGVYGLIYSFHMPLFVLLSGYFFKVCDWKSEVRKNFRLLETFVTITIVFWIAGGMTYSWPLVRLSTCPSWYLFSLVCWRVVTNVALRRCRIENLIITSIVLSVMAYLVINYGEGIFAIMRTIQFYPYFLLGYAIRQGLVDAEKLPKQTIFFASLILTVIVALLSNYALYTQEFQGVGLFRWCNQFGMPLLVGGGWLLVKTVSLTNSFVVWKYVRMPSRLASFGQSSLLIYAIHTMTVPLIYQHCKVLWLTLLAGVVTLAIGMLISQCRIAIFITNPMTTIIDKISNKIKIK